MQAERVHNFLRSRRVAISQELTQILGHRMALSRAVSSGHIKSIGGGYYSDKELKLSSALVLVVAKYYPHAVVSGLGGLLIHGFTIDGIEKLPIETDPQSFIKNQIFKVKRVRSQSALKDCEEKTFMNHQVRTYSLEKCLCEVYRKHTQKRSVGKTGDDSQSLKQQGLEFIEFNLGWSHPKRV